MPAIATTTRPAAPSHARSHGEERETVSGSASITPRSTAGPSAGSAPSAPAAAWARSESIRRCTPLPARVVTSPVVSERPRRRWFTVSATSTSHPSRAATSSGSTSRPLGSLKRAVSGPPSRCPRVPGVGRASPAASAEACAGSPPPHARSTVVRSSATSTIRWCPVSATRNAPGCEPRPPSETALPGNFRSRATGAGGTYGPLPRCRVPLASCSATSSCTRECRPATWPSPERVAAMHPSGSTTTRVGHARAE